MNMRHSFALGLACLLVTAGSHAQPTPSVGLSAEKLSQLKAAVQREVASQQKLAQLTSSPA